MIKKSIPVLLLLLFSACSSEKNEVSFQSQNYERHQKTNKPLAKAQAKLCKGSVFFIPYGDSSMNFEGINEEAIKDGKIKIKGLKDIDLSANIDIRVEYSNYVIGSKKCIVIEGEMISPKFNKVSNKNSEEDDESSNNQDSSDNQKSSSKKAKSSK